MNTAKIWADIFTARTTGSTAIYDVRKLTQVSVDSVLRGVQMNLNTEGATEDLKRGYLRREVHSGFYGGSDGYIPTAKGIRAILAELNKREAIHV